MAGVEFQRVGKSYHVYTNGEFRYTADEIAIAVNFVPEYERCVAHVHGSPEHVLKWVRDAQQKFRAGGLDQYADRIVIISSSEWDLEELNKIWNCTGSINSFLKRNEITDEGQGHREEVQPQSQDVPEA